MTIAAVLLAAGEGARMGRAKALLDWDGRALIEYQIEQLSAPPIDRIVAVLGHAAEEIVPLVRHTAADLVVNERYAEGRASSLRAGAAALADDTEAIVVLNVDQPRPHDVIARLVDVHQLSGSLITVPMYLEHRGHPPVLSGSLLPELRQASEETLGLRGVLAAHAADVSELAFETDVVLIDINDEETYAAARSRFLENGGLG